MTARQLLFPSSAPPVAEGSFYGDDVDTVDGSSHGDRHDDDDDVDDVEGRADGDELRHGSTTGRTPMSLHASHSAEDSPPPPVGSFSHDSYELYKDFPDDYDDEYATDTVPSAHGNGQSTTVGHQESQAVEHPPSSARDDPANTPQQEQQAAAQKKPQPQQQQRLQVDELEGLFDHLTKMSTGTAAGSTYADSVGWTLRVRS